MMTTPHNPMEGRRVTAMANDPECARRFGGSGDYHQAWEQDTDDGTAEVLVLRHVLNDGLTGRAAPPRWQWAWAAYAVWPMGEPGVPGVYEWLAVEDAWLVGGQPYPTQRAAVTAALALARERHQPHLVSMWPVVTVEHLDHQPHAHHGTRLDGSWSGQ